MLTIYAPEISGYGRTVAIIAEEAGLSWRIEPTDARSDRHRQRHPFLKTPAVEIDGHQIYETIAICQYIDDVHNQGALQPTDPLARARMSQWISIINQYVFPATEYGLVMPRLIAPMMGREPREDLIEKALPTIAYQLTVVSNRLEEGPYLAGDSLSLADFFLFPIARAVDLTPEGGMILDRLLPLRTWIRRLEPRSSIAATRWPGE